MDLIMNLVNVLNEFLWSYILIILLIGLGLIFTIKTNFVQFRYFFEMIKLLTENVGEDKSKHKVSSFQAFCISTASRVGTGNLAGVAIAITAGGPGAVFWMWLIALIGGASSFIESTLAQIYKVKDGENFRGGPAYYMEKGLKKRWLGIIFAFLITFTYGFAFNATQSNTIASAFETAFGLDKIVVGIIVTILTAVVIFGGVKRIANISSAIVPIMASIYVLIALYVIITNVTMLPTIFKMIFKDAFGVKQFAAGFAGSAIMQGIKRGLFSNEAGMGSAPNAAATAHTTHPVKQGLIQTLGVFTDTILICSATSFIILIYIASGVSVVETDGIQLTQSALAHKIPGAEIFVAISIFLFAYSSVIGNYYYGETNIEFLTRNKLYPVLYKIFVLVFVMTGAMASLDKVWAFADLFMGLMSIINMVSIAMLSGIAIKALKDYQRQKKENKNPVFTKDSILEIKDDLECWDNNN